MSRIALSGFSDVSAINSVPVAGPACVACVAVSGFEVASVLGEKSESCSGEHIDTKAIVNMALDGGGSNIGIAGFYGKVLRPPKRP